MRNNHAVYKDCCTRIAPHLNSNMRVLELACGTGEFTDMLADYAEEYIATDFSEAMAARNRKRGMLNSEWKTQQSSALNQTLSMPC